jgi:glycosyltransferase involved in cell wall biosynthesis
MNAKARVKILSLGVDTSYYSPDLVTREDTLSLVFIGDLLWLPNRDGILWFLDKIYPVLKSKFTDLKCYIIGRGGDNLRNLHLNGVITPGYVKDVRPFMANASCIIVPLRIGGGMRVKILESLAMGKGLITTSIGYEGIEAIPGRDLLVADTPNEFIEATSRILEDKKLRQYLGNNGRKLVQEKYSWYKIVSGLQDIYENLINDQIQ